MAFLGDKPATFSVLMISMMEKYYDNAIKFYIINVVIKQK